MFNKITEMNEIPRLVGKKKPYQRLRAEEIKQIRYYFNQGLDCKAIAAKMDKSYGTIYTHTSRYKRRAPSRGAGGGIKPHAITKTSGELLITDLVTTQKVLNALGLKLTIAKINN